MNKILLAALLLWTGGGVAQEAAIRPVLDAQPAVYRGGADALRGEIARKMAEEFIRRTERAHRRAATPANGVRGMGRRLDADELRSLLGGWLLPPQVPSTAVAASFTISERGEVGNVRILQTSAKEYGEVMEAVLPHCDQWMSRRRGVAGAKRNVPDSVVVRIPVVQIRDSLDSRIEARTKIKKR